MAFLATAWKYLVIVAVKLYRIEPIRYVVSKIVKNLFFTWELFP